MLRKLACQLWSIANANKFLASDNRVIFLVALDALCDLNLAIRLTLETAKVHFG